MDNETGNLVRFPGYVMGNVPDNVFSYVNDFTEYAAGDWTISETSATGTPTIAVTTDGSNGGFGVLDILNDGAEDDYTCLAGPEIVKLEAGKPLVFKCRVAIDDTKLAEWCLGLAKVSDTDPLDAGAFFIPDFMGFVGGETEGDDTVTFRCTKDSTVAGNLESDTGTGLMVDDAFVELAFYYDGNGSAVAYRNGAKLGEITTNIPDDEYLCVLFCINNSTAVGRTMMIDYVGVWQQR